MPKIDASSASDAARAELETAFAQRDRYLTGERTRVGIFGNGMPTALVEAAGACAVHVELAEVTTGGGSPIDVVIEPFLDASVSTFLNRFSRGEFADLQGIIFARDDAPALIAYQYAIEWVRQGRANSAVPPLFLWNLVHTDTEPTRHFNRVQADKLFGFFEAIGLRRPGPAQISAAIADEKMRAASLVKLSEAREQGVPAAQALRLRNAGRFMPASKHDELLKAALSLIEKTPAAGRPRIGVIGSPLLSLKTYDMFDRLGVVTCDLQPWGDVWPGNFGDAKDLDELLVSTAADRSCHRIVPSEAYRQAILEATANAGCDVVICQLAQTDDTIGWEVPALAEAFSSRGTAFVNLGFRDPEPDEAWLADAAAAISAALGARQ